MKFVRAFHKKDAEEVQQTIGVTADGQVWLRITGWTDDSEPGYANARFAPADALKFAFELANLARYAKTVQLRHEQFEAAPEEVARIVGIALADAGIDPASMPGGTTASRCTACDEVRLSYSGDLTDEWKNHFDYCGDDEAEVTQ